MNKVPLLDLVGVGGRQPAHDLAQLGLLEPAEDVGDVVGVEIVEQDRDLFRGQPADDVGRRLLAQLGEHQRSALDRQHLEQPVLVVWVEVVELRRDLDLVQALQDPRDSTGLVAAQQPSQIGVFGPYHGEPRAHGTGSVRRGRVSGVVLNSAPRTGAPILSDPVRSWLRTVSAGRTVCPLASA